MERARDLLCVVLPGLIVVGQDHDTASPQIFCEVRRPLSGPAGIAGRNQKPVAQRLDVLLSLHNEHRLGRCGRQQLGEAIGNAAHSLSAPGPSARAIRAALDEGLRRLPDDLVEEGAVCVSVVVSRHNGGISWPVSVNSLV